ncbi:hypothetical protein Clacol_000628 [Clathrus columnatus]|uniref:Muskelin N-terminal domain-containing protein n=1 Tax=Clathrus columnatus TaxID=1419009 RepID=A0AAV4ZWU3_9AGAM|nr:hypothetical protein Clacol_000628 [Clathrus columnatus]
MSWTSAENLSVAGSSILKESPPFFSNRRNTGHGGEDLSLSELCLDSDFSENLLEEKPFSLLPPQSRNNAQNNNHNLEAATQSTSDSNPINAIDASGKSTSTRSQREEQLQRDLFVLKKLNASMSVYMNALKSVSTATENATLQMDRTEKLLNLYVDLMRETEKNSQLIFDETWQGGSDDLQLVAQLKQEAAEREERERQEKERIIRMEREKREKERKEELEREAKQRKEQERAAAKMIKATRGMRVSSIPSVPLKYRIAKCTGHSGTYGPENILVDNPTDQSSRWSGGTQSANTQHASLQYETIQGSSISSELYPSKKPTFVIKVYVGRTMDTLSLALHEGLVNNSIPETYPFQRTNRSGLLVPIRYIKIVPLSAHSPNFNTSIWHVAISGVNEPQVVKHAQDAYTQYMEANVLRHVLKFLRQKRHLAVYHTLLRRSHQQLEHPTISRLYDELMLGNWSTVESLIESAAFEGLFDRKIGQYDPKAIWRRLNGTIADGEVPSARGGHQMCIDVEAGIIYIFGGWNGKHDLDDLWCYYIDEQRWRLLSKHTAQDGGPSPRSCHKMVFDPLTGYLYILGRVGDVEGLASAPPATSIEATNSAQPTTLPGGGVPPSVSAENPKRLVSDFYRYSTRGPNAGQWTLLSEDTAAEDGPCLIYDHQIAIDSEKQILYVSGGRVVDNDMDTGSMRFSGFYQYHIITGKWERIIDETSSLKPDSRSPHSRYGHSMTFDPVRRRLIIMAGKTGETFLSDMYIYDVDSQTITDVTNDFTTQGGPDPSFCQRAVVDPESGFLLMLPGFLKPKSQEHTKDGSLQSAFWIYKPESSRWVKVSGFRPSETDWQANEDTELEPTPRFAHEMVYDPVRKLVYVHGGNSGHEESKRLDDFWSMQLVQFKEICEVQSPVQALTFLQREVYSMVDHSSEEESATFRALHSHLFEKVHPHSNNVRLADEDAMVSVGEHHDGQTIERSEPSDTRSSSKSGQSEEGYEDLDESHFMQRTEVFEALLELVNPDAKQPESDLMGIMEELDMSYP